MKFLKLSLAVLSLAVLSTINAKAAPLVTEAPITSGGTPSTLSVSTSAWTKAPETSTLPGRTGVLISVPASNTANMVGHIASCTSTSVAISVRPMEFVKGNGFTLVPVADSICVYLLSINGSAESVHVQEIKQ